jgi:hypothetical protein
MSFNIEEYPKHWNIRKRAEARLEADKREALKWRRRDPYSGDRWIKSQLSENN